MKTIEYHIYKFFQAVRTADRRKSMNAYDAFGIVAALLFIIAIFVIPN